MCATSAATALAARFAARLQSNYPDYWPETIRALVVHSAEWTEPMKALFAPLNSRQSREKLLRMCGFGVPDFDRACWSASNELTLVAQDTIQPFDKVDNRLVNRYINYHKLPWPKEMLHQLGETQVELRITLSYFIEPSPGERGWSGRYKYASHALRFDVRKAGESDDIFKRRINAEARTAEFADEDYGNVDPNWYLGPQLRHLGSLNADRWNGRAADLADLDLVGVYPVMGWWKARQHLGRWGRIARYALVVSILAPEETAEIEAVDIYTPVKYQIEIEIPIAIEGVDEGDNEA